MKSSILRHAALLLLLALSLLFIAGCHSNTVGEKPGDEMNSAMTPQQKALLTERKKKDDQ